MNVQDRRRLLGPVSARPLTFSAIDPSMKIESESVEKRDSSEIIELLIETGFIENCNGSSMIETAHDNRKVSMMTSVYGPKAIRGSFTSQASLSIQIKNGLVEKYTDSELQEISEFLHSIFTSIINLKRYPKSGIDVFVHLTYDEDSRLSLDITPLLPHIISSVTLALIDADVEIIDMVSAGESEGSVFSFVKGGEEIVGYWNSNSRLDDLDKALEVCKSKYLSYRSTMISFLMKKQTEGKDTSSSS